jgi:hypothetical protein
MLGERCPGGIACEAAGAVFFGALRTFLCEGGKGVKKLLVAMLLLLPIDASAEEDPNSAKWLMPGCRAAVAGSNEELFYQGYCVAM